MQAKFLVRFSDLISPLNLKINKGFYGNFAFFNPLNAKLNPICHLLALLGAGHIFHVSRLRVNINNMAFTRVL